MMSLQPYAYYDSGDYEINNHTRGVSLSFTDQLNPQNLLEVEGSYTTSTGARIYNEQMFQYGHAYGNAFAVLVNRNEPFSGTCYRYYGNGGSAYTIATTCSRRAGAAASPTANRCRRFSRSSNPTDHAPTLRRDLRRRPVRLLRRRERRVRFEQYGHAVLLRLLDHRSVAPERPALLQPRRSRR